MGLSEDLINVPQDLARRLAKIETDVYEMRRASGLLGLTRLGNGTVLIPGGITVGGGNAGGPGVVINPTIPTAPGASATTAADSTACWIDLTLTYPTGLNAVDLQLFEIQYQRSGDAGWAVTTVQGLTVRISGLIPGTTYNWRARYVTITGLVGPWVTGSTVTATDTGVPAKTVGVTVSVGFRTILVRWTDNTDLDVTQGRGLYRVRVDVLPKMLSPVKDVKVGGTITGFQDLNPATTYYAEVAAIDNSGNQGPWSSQVSTFGPAQLVFNFAARTIVRSSGSWVTDGVAIGDVIDLTSTSLNNTTYTVTNVAALTLTITENPLTETAASARAVVRRPAFSTTQRITAGGAGTDLAADTITAYEIAAATITAAELSTTLALIGQQIRSSSWNGAVVWSPFSYTPGTAGWSILTSPAGATYVEFNGGSVLKITGGAISAGTITSTSIDSSTITGGTIQTSTGTSKVVLNGALDRVEVYNAGNLRVILDANALHFYNSTYAGRLGSKLDQGALYFYDYTTVGAPLSGVIVSYTGTGGVDMYAYAGGANRPRLSLVGSGTPYALLDCVLATGTAEIQAASILLKAGVLTHVNNGYFSVSAGNVRINDGANNGFLSLVGTACGLLVYCRDDQTKQAMLYNNASYVRLWSSTVGDVMQITHSGVDVRFPLIYSQAGGDQAANFFSASSQLFRVTSSRRMKRNIVDMDAELPVDRILRDLRPVVYTGLTGDPNDPSTHFIHPDQEGVRFAGFIAEEVAEVWPDAVTHDSTGAVSGLRSGMLEAVMFRALQHLEARVAALEAA